MFAIPRFVGKALISVCRFSVAVVLASVDCAVDRRHSVLLVHVRFAFAKRATSVLAMCHWFRLQSSDPHLRVISIRPVAKPHVYVAML